MPELPEVETIRLQLNKYIVGSTIKSIDIRNPKYNINLENILDHKIISVRRFAKQLSIDLDNDFSIMIHVKLTGQIIYRGERLPHVAKGYAGLSPKVTGGLGGKHTHLIFHLDSGDLYYNDVRQFGWVKIVKSEQETGNSFAPEPLKDLTLELFKQILGKTKRPIKVVIMDQTKMGGVGNIYATDALWLAGINPSKQACQINSKEVEKLYDAIILVLKTGLKYGGASELSFVTPDGKEGEYQNHTLAYGHTGELCSNCHKEKITKYFLGGRGTYVCPVCQK
jgi:formamidopyrimidine-DNA glycosylase